MTMPGFGTTDRTYDNAVSMIRELGVTFREVDIKAAVLQHFSDIGHDPEQHDVTYENGQARERTQILMDIANQTEGFVVGTGDDVGAGIGMGHLQRRSHVHVRGQCFGAKDLVRIWCATMRTPTPGRN